MCVCARVRTHERGFATDPSLVSHESPPAPLRNLQRLFEGNQSEEKQEHQCSCGHSEFTCTFLGASICVSVCVCVLTRARELPDSSDTTRLQQ